MDTINESIRETLDFVDYSRQSELDSILPLRDSNNIIIGCGGVGFWTGLMLAMLGFSKITLIDADKLEATNIARIPVPTTWIGVNKAVALRKVIHSIRPLAQVRVLNMFINEDTLDIFNDLLTESHGIVWDATDDATAQETIYARVKDVGLSYRKIGYEGWEVANYPSYDKMWSTGDVQRGYRTAKANALSSIFASCLGILSLSTASPAIKLDMLKLAKGEKDDQKV